MIEHGSKGHILFMTYDGMTDPLGQSQVIPYAAGLTKLGYSFTLISFEKADRFAKYSAELYALLDKHKIEWAPISYTKSPPVLSTLWDTWRWRQKVLWLHKKKPYTMLHCRSYPAALMGLMLKKKYNVPFLFDMRGFYADERVDGGLWKLSNPVYSAVYNFYKRKETEFLQQTSYIISLTHKAKDIVANWRLGMPKQVPIDVIPCCADLDLFSVKSVDESLKQELLAKFGLKQNQFVLSYLGSIGSWYMLDEMLDYFKCLLAKRPEAKFLFITADPVDSIVKKAREKGIPENALIISPAARKDVPTYLSLSDWSIFFIKPAFSKQASSPTKQAEIMGMGLPHVCNAGVGDVDSIVNSDKLGLLINIPANGDYSAEIDKMLAATTDATEIRRRAEEEFSLTQGVTRFAYAYQYVTDKP